MIFKKSNKFNYYLISLLFLVAVFLICKSIHLFKEDDVYTYQSEIENTNTTENSDDMIGIWVPFMDLEINSTEETEKKFKEKFQEIINESKKNKINTLVVHVRSHSDALYPSRFFPWSHSLTGIQGLNPGFDALEYMVKKAHENNLKFQAWINPLRVKSIEYPKSLSENNPYFKFESQDYFIEHTGGTYYNPAYPEIQKLIVDGVKEIAENYDVDGIHFDDYFYPEEKNMTSKDKAYEHYLKSQENNNYISITDWRKKHINELISETYSSIKQINPKIQFGISPSGNIEKCYEAGADIEEWLSKEGYLDYICPQIYWSLDFKNMPFEKTAINWKNILKNENIKIYGGLALYKKGTSLDENTWNFKNNILETQVKILKDLKYNGFILYSWGFLNSENTIEELTNLQKEINN